MGIIILTSWILHFQSLCTKTSHIDISLTKYTSIFQQKYDIQLSAYKHTFKKSQNIIFFSLIVVNHATSHE